MFPHVSKRPGNKHAFYIFSDALFVFNGPYRKYLLLDIFVACIALIKQPYNKGFNPYTFINPYVFSVVNNGSILFVVSNRYNIPMDASNRAIAGNVHIVDNRLISLKHHRRVLTAVIASQILFLFLQM